MSEFDHPVEIAVMLALAQRDMHAYAIVKQVQEDYELGYLRPQTIYRTIDKLVQHKHISSLPQLRPTPRPRPVRHRSDMFAALGDLDAPELPRDPMEGLYMPKEPIIYHLCQSGINRLHHHRSQQWQVIEAIRQRVG